MHDNPSIQAPIHFHKGIPSQEDIDNLYNGEFHIIVLDDLMEKIVKSIEMLFTKYCHHRNMTAIMVSQNVFQKGPNAGTISLNTHIYVFFANKRDEAEVSILVHQLFLSKMKKKKIFYHVR